MNDKDIGFFKMLYCCGVITNYGISIMNISSYKLNKYVSNNMIQVVFEDGIRGYKLTSKSKNILSKKYGLNKNYIFRSIKHCSKLQEIYLNLDLNRYKWITESEALNLINKKEYNLLNISPVDAIIVDCETNVMYGIEVVTKSYREKDLIKKEKFLSIFNILAVFIDS